MVGLTERDMQAVVNSYKLKDFYYPTLFPLKETQTLTWKSLEAQVGLHIAGDLVARGATLNEKTREALTRLQGDIPKVAIKRVKNEDELNEYEIMVAMTSQNPDLRALVDAWAEDTNYCWTGVASRLEWMALQSISKGKVVLTNDNNNSVITEYALDYSIPSAQKSGYVTGSAAWTSTSSAKPFSKDFKKVVSDARAKGISLKYAFMNENTFAQMVETEEVVKLAASFANNALNIATTPSVEQVNTAMRGLAYLKGLQVIVIDQQITIEKNDGTRVTANPFIDDVVMFSESSVLGKTFWKRPADMSLNGSAAMKVMNGHTCIKKYSTEEPISEVTVGIANAVPAWETSQRCFLMDVNHSTWQN